MEETARRAFVASSSSARVVVLALALWKLKLLIALLFLAFIIAAAMRPGVEALQRLRIPRGVGILIHYAALLGLVGLLLWLVVPRAIDQVQTALGEENLQQETEEATGWKREVLDGSPAAARGAAVRTTSSSILRSR